MEALVRHITSDAAAKRFYGADWDKARALGVIVRVEKVLPNARSKVRQTIITAKYRLPDGREKDISLNKRSIVFTNQAPPATLDATVDAPQINAAPRTSDATVAALQSNAAPRASDATVATLQSNAAPRTSDATAVAPQSNATPLPPATSNPTGTPNTTTDAGPRSNVPSLSHVSVINAFNVVAADNPNIAQVVHDCIWENSLAQDVVVAQDIPSLQWYWIDNFGDKLYPGARPYERLSQLVIFYQVFPREQINLILMLTNEKLALVRGKKLAEGELIKFFGILVLTTCYEFGARRDLWSQTKKTK